MKTVTPSVLTNEFEVKALSARQAQDLQTYLKDVLGIEHPKDGALVILSDSDNAVTFPSHNRWLLTDSIRLQNDIKEAIKHGDMELAAMAQRTLDAIVNPVDDIDIPL